MATYKELVYMCLDELKLKSDDSFIQQEHIIFLLDKYRAFILKQRYSDTKKEIPESNYQTICLDLEKTQGIDGDDCSDYFLKSKQKIPNMLTIAKPKVSTLNYFIGNINYVSRNQFKYAGGNRYLHNIIYSTLSPDKYLFLKSDNPQYQYLNKVRVTGIFEDSSKAAELSCDKDDKHCDVLDMSYPLEEGLVPPVIELIVKDLTSTEYKPTDDTNNANDDLSDVSNGTRRVQQGNS